MINMVFLPRRIPCHAPDVHPQLPGVAAHWRRSVGWLYQVAHVLPNVDVVHHAAGVDLPEQHVWVIGLAVGLVPSMVVGLEQV